METLFLFLAAAAYFVFALRRIEMAIIWLPLFFPLYLIKGEMGGVPFTLIEVFIYASALAFCLKRFWEVLSPQGKFATLFSSIKDFITPRESFVHHFRRLLPPVFLVVLAAFLTLLVTENELVLIDGQIFQGMRVALGILKGWIIAPVIYLLLLLATLRKTEQGMKVLNVYTLSAVLLGLWCVYQVISQNYITPDARASGPFESANYLALYIAPALLYGLVRLREALFPPGEKVAGPIRGPAAAMFLMASLILLIALLATKSYAALIATFGAIFFYFFLEYCQQGAKKRLSQSAWKLFMGISVVLLLALLAVFMIDPDKWQAMFQFAERNSSSVRLEVYAIAWGLIADNWLMGIGMGQFPALYQIEAVNILGHVPYEWNMLHPHNLFLALWLNLGLLGLGSFLYVLGVCLQHVWPHFCTFAMEKINSLGKMRVLAFSLLLIIFIHGFFDTPFFKNDLALLFWMIVGVLYAPRE